jgi:hypothetical protein
MLPPFRSKEASPSTAASRPMAGELIKLSVPARKSCHHFTEPPLSLSEST